MKDITRGALWKRIEEMHGPGSASEALQQKYPVLTDELVDALNSYGKWPLGKAEVMVFVALAIELLELANPPECMAGGPR